MIKLNYNFKIGDKVRIDHFSWQVTERRIIGDYEIIKHEKDEDCVLEDIITLKRLTDGREIECCFLLIAFLTGQKVPKAAPWEGLDGYEYQPDWSETNIMNDEGDTDTSFVYAGWRGNSDFLDWDGFPGMWCYTAYPWNKN